MKGRRTQGTGKKLRGAHIQKLNREPRAQNLRKAKGGTTMKKQEVLEKMRKTAITAYEVDQEWAKDESGRSRVAGSLMTLCWLARSIFGEGSEEETEFDYYFDNRNKPMPQPTK